MHAAPSTRSNASASGINDHGGRALVTGCAGFLASHLSEALVAQGREVVGVDCFTSYYARRIKQANLAALLRANRFRFIEADLAAADLAPLLDGVDVVFHLAAQPGVRHSFGPGFGAYLRHNVEATRRLLEAACEHSLKAFVYASSSSVYGDQDAYPVREDAPLRPVSPYGGTKVITEQLAQAFWRSAGVPVVGLRYFTVYGPRQRPDMAFARFVASALAGRPLTVLGDGRQVREFTYVGDVVDATIAAASRGERGSVYNVGGGVPVALIDAIALLEQLLERHLDVVHGEAGVGDPRRTDADITRAGRDLGYEPSTPLSAGLAAQIDSLEGGSAHTCALVGRRGARARSQPAAPLDAGSPGTAAGRVPRVLAYSHDGYGLGHLRRNLRILAGLRRELDDVEALLVTGAKSAETLVAPFGFDCVPLPAVVKVANGRYAADDGEGSFEQVLRRRAALIADAVREFRPDLLLVDRYPRGMHDELSAALEARAAYAPGARAVLGLRDILDAPATIRREWRAGGYSKAIREVYTTVLCYGDADVYDPVREYALPRDIAEKLRFTGYLADDLMDADGGEVRRRHALEDRRVAVCTLGGGKDAAPIAHAFLSAVTRLRPRGWSGVLIAGPYMSAKDLAGLRRHEAARSVPVLRMVDDVPSYLAAADAAVCMGGYNTVCELLALAVPAVIVPRTQPRQEQRMRAQLLRARGLLSWVEPSQLSANELAEAIERAGVQPRHELAGRIGSIDHHGIRSSARYLAELLPVPRAAPRRARPHTGAAPGRLPPAARSGVAGAGL
jgi:UDP-glucose 4-epimerase